MPAECACVFSVCDIYISLSSRWPKHTIVPFSSQQATSHSSPGAAAGGIVCGCVSLCFLVYVCGRPASIIQAVGRAPCGLGHMPNSNDTSCLK